MTTSHEVHFFLHIFLYWVDSNCFLFWGETLLVWGNYKPQKDTPSPLPKYRLVPIPVESLISIKIFLGLASCWLPDLLLWRVTFSCLPWRLPETQPYKADVCLWPKSRGAVRIKHVISIKGFSSLIKLHFKACAFRLVCGTGVCDGQVVSAPLLFNVYFGLHLSLNNRFLRRVFLNPPNWAKAFLC